LISSLSTIPIIAARWLLERLSARTAENFIKYYCRRGSWAKIKTRGGVTCTRRKTARLVLLQSRRFIHEPPSLNFKAFHFLLLIYYSPAVLKESSASSKFMTLGAKY